MTDRGGHPQGEPSKGFPSRLFNRAVGAIVPTVVDQVDVEEVIERLDVNQVVERIDVNQVLERIDVEHLLDRVDPNRLLDRVDVDHLLDRVDVNRLLDRVDVDRIVERADVDQLLDRVDPNRLLERVDVNRLVQRMELEALISRSTTGVFSQVLDVARIRLMAVDQVVQYAPSRLRNRRGALGPATPANPTDIPDLSGQRPRERAVTLQGHHAGSVSRFLAFLVDQFFIGFLFGVGALLIATATEVVIGRQLDVGDGRWQFALAYALWSYTYVVVQLAATGRTIGKAALGLLVLGAKGADLSGRQALLRALAFPLSFVLFGAGFLIGLLRRDRRQLHDLIAGTAVVYAWAPAELAATRTS